MAAPPGAHSSGASSWTTPAQLRSQVVKLWDRGDLGRAVITAAVPEGAAAGSAPDAGVDVARFRETEFPLRLTLRKPTSRELTEQFDQVRDWVDRVDGNTGIRIERRRVKHRVLGANDLPAEAWVDTLADGLAVAGRSADGAVLTDLAAKTAQRRPGLVGWLRRRPVVALTYAEVWDQLLDVVDWVEARPNPGIYLRQVDLPGVDTKLIETHRQVLAELIDLAVPAAVMDPTATGVRGFERRYGFRSKPNLIRFRLLDPTAAGDPGLDLGVPGLGGINRAADVTVDAATFARLDPPVGTVFLVENEINFLAFPAVPDAMVIWVAGFGTERLAAAAWMADRSLRYWGDLDTHGFAILDELRRRFPQVSSFLMDRQTLLDHHAQWVTEPDQETRDLPRLTTDEAVLYDDLRHDRLGHGVRLEQERIRYGHLHAATGGG